MESQDFHHRHTVKRAPRVLCVKRAVWGPVARHCYCLTGTGPVEGGWQAPGSLALPSRDEEHLPQVSQETEWKI